MTENKQTEPNFYSGEARQFLSLGREILFKTKLGFLILALALASCAPQAESSKTTPHPEAPQEPVPEQTEDPGVNEVEEAALSVNCAELLAILIHCIDFQRDGSIITVSPEDLPDHVLVALSKIGLGRNSKIWEAMAGCFGEYTLVKNGTKLQFGKKDWKNLGHYPPQPKEQVKTPGVKEFETANPNPIWIFIPNPELDGNTQPTPQLIPLAPGAETQVLEQGDKYMILSVATLTGTATLLVMFFPGGILIAGPAILAQGSGILAPALIPVQ